MLSPFWSVVVLFGLVTRVRYVGPGFEFQGVQKISFCSGASVSTLGAHPASKGYEVCLRGLKTAKV